MPELDVIERLRAGAQDKRDDTIGLRFERIATATPDRCAIVTPQGTLTYGALNARADIVATQLATAALDRKRPIALMIDDIGHFAAAMLGAAKAGQMFIPFEIGAPESWCAQIVEHAGVQAMLTEPLFLDRAGRIAPAKVAIWNIETAGRSQLYRGGLTVSPATPAYILYTSGSSGSPKGVVISHEAAVHHVDIRAEHFAVRSDDRFALLHSPCFSAGTINLLVTLLNGACLFPFSLQKESLHRFADWINENGITSFSIVGSSFRTWLAQLPQALRLPSVRLIIPTSEALYGSDAARIARHLTGNWKLGHILAITETGTVAGYNVSSSTVLEPGILPVGTPLRDMDILIEDENGNSVPPGEIGEIVVRSRYISSGYWKDEALTGAAFRTDPNEASIKFYRTGDLGRWRSDGLLEHLGRRDRKVKLRGYSIELYEVECALLRVPGVCDVSVILDEGAESGAQLVAYVVADRIVSGSAQQLRRSLAAMLPEYMIPSRVIFLDQMPLTARGKIDRDALPARETAERETVYRAPSSSVEIKLTTIWEEVFGLGKIGVDDNFYELGGSSLQAFTIFARIADTLGRDLPPTLMMRVPTIAQQAELLATRNCSVAAETLVAFRSEGTKPPLFIVHGGGGDIMFARELTRDLNSDRPVYGLQPPPLDGTQRLPRRVEKIAAAYLEQIREVQPSGPYYLSGYSSGGFIALEIAQRLIDAGERVSFLGLIDTKYGAKHLVAGEAVTSRVHRHLDQVLREPPWPYLMRRVKKTWAHQAGLLYEALRHISNDIRCWMRCPIPHDLRAPYYQRIYFRASRRYLPQPYPGAIAMFCRKGTAAWHAARWRAIARDALIVREIPAGHLEMVWPPHSSILARAFDECLDCVS